MDLKETDLQLNRQTILLLTGKAQFISPEQAWHAGTNIQKAVREAPELCRGWIMAEVGRLCKDVDAKKTLSSDEELLFTCRAILSEHVTLKLEEISVCFDMIRMGKFGKLYERLKTAEILECLRRYEGEIRAEILEKNQHNVKNEYVERMIDRIDPELIRDFINDERVIMQGEGVGTRLRKKLDAYAPIEKE